MDFKTEAMAGAVEKTDLPAIATFRWLAAVSEKLLHFGVQFQSIDAGLHFFQRQGLTFPHCFPKPSLLVAGAATNHRPRHVAEIAGRRVAGKNVQDDERI